ncbi:hypothetical protein Tcan_05625 [Toxocara canis]|uniref:Transmembrane protein n=1 Tax=Toxocara canis TaxID=6265 RepID=A0A0B2VTJ2_TOXCA|nr:hypothetical protein Tcan_05625 [Toxocara canis]
MAIRIFELGAGIVILMFLWSFTLILFIACVRVGKIIGGVATVLLVTVVSTLLLVWPNASSSSIRAGGGEDTEMRVVDNVMLVRLMLIVALCVVLFISTVRLFNYHLAQPLPSTSSSTPDHHRLNQRVPFSHKI